MHGYTVCLYLVGISDDQLRAANYHLSSSVRFTPLSSYGPAWSWNAYATLSSAPEIHSSPFRAPERLVVALLPVTVFLATGCGNPKAEPRFRTRGGSCQRASETQKEIPSGAPAFDLVLAGPDRPIPTKALFCTPIARWTQRQATLRSLAHFALVSLEDCGRRQKWKQWNATSRRVPCHFR